MTVPDAALARWEMVITAKLGLRLATHQKSRAAAALDDVRLRLGMSDLGEVADFLACADPADAAWQYTVRQVTIGETSFFRHSEWFESLVAGVLRPIVANRLRDGSLKIRVWSAGCSTGEEPYSLAIALRHALPFPTGWAIEIVASDINAAALEAAREARYSEWALRSVPEDARARYFSRSLDGFFVVDAAIRDMVRFQLLNLAASETPAPASGAAVFDLVLCRNVIMYFTPECQARVIGRMSALLREGGYFAVSPAEAAAELFRPLVPKPMPSAIFFEKQPFAEPRAAKPIRTRIPPARSDIVLERKPAAALQEPPISTSADAGRSERDWLECARKLADAGSLSEARERCLEAISAERNAERAYGGEMLLAIVCEELGDLPAAVAAARRANYRNPASLEAVFLLARILIAAGEVDRGRRLMAQVAVRTDETDSDGVFFPSIGMSAGLLKTLSRRYLEMREFSERETKR